MGPACAGSRSVDRHERYHPGPPAGAQTGARGQAGAGGVPPQPAGTARGPQDVGLPSGARRRTPGPAARGGRRARAHLHRVLRPARAGSCAAPSGEVLAGIARTLRLTDAESDHLHLLAGTAPSRTRLHRRDVRPSILALLDRLPQTAAFVVSAAFEVLAWNDLAAALMEDFGRLDPARPQPGPPGVPRPTTAAPPLYGVSDAGRLPARRRHGSARRRSRATRATPPSPGSSASSSRAAPTSPGCGRGTTCRRCRC